MIDWPEQLITNLARRRGILMIGSGVSRNSRGINGEVPPTWRKFLDDALLLLEPKPKHIANAIKSGNYLDACDWLNRALDERWMPLLRKKFQEPQYKPARIHEILYDIDCRIVLTPNFDRIYDLYAERISEGTTFVKSHTDHDILSHIRQCDRIVIKAHGTIQSPAQMIFSRAQYAKARSEHADFYRILEAILLTNTVLMVGVGLEDPDFQLIFEDSAARFNVGLPHYMTISGDPADDVERTVRETRNIKFLRYSAQDDHKELVVSLENLLKQVTQKREDLAREADW